MNTAMRRSFSTWRRMIISGSDSAMTLIMKASTVPSAAPLPSSASTIGMTPAALVYIGMPMSTAAGTDHQVPAPMMRTIRSSRHVAVDQGAHGDAEDDPDPDLAEDLAHGLEPSR